MRILLVQENEDLGRIWCRFLERHGVTVDYAGTQAQAFEALGTRTYDALVIDPVLHEPGDGLAVADMATVRNPDIVILAVTKSTFLSEGSIFSLIPNARGVMHTPMRPDDLLAYLQHFHARSGAGGQELQAAQSGKA
jgi:DNA-binding response OmpR family regulator